MKPSRHECCPACGHKDRLTTTVSCITDEEFIECAACRATFQEVTVLVPYERREPEKPRDYLLERVNWLEQQVSILRGIPLRNYCYSCDHEPCNGSGKACPRESLRR